MGAAFFGCQALVLEHMLTVTSTERLPALVERLTQQSLVKELLVSLKDIVEVAMEGQLKDAGDASWAAFAAVKEVEGKEMVSLLPELRILEHSRR